eukprot:4751973-Amphidinium_carterae.1
MDDCAGEMGEYVEGDLNLEGPVTALPGGHGRVVPHLSLVEGLRSVERGGDQPDRRSTFALGLPLPLPLPLP